MTLALVTAAGAAGVAARYGLSSAFDESAFPWVTVAINVVGSFLLGALVVFTGLSTELRAALGAGLLGGFTTFSTFSVQAVMDVDAGRPGRAFLYVAVSVVGGLAAAALGYSGARAIHE